LNIQAYIFTSNWFPTDFFFIPLLSPFLFLFLFSSPCWYC
jgi:hypothetical protein